MTLQQRLQALAGFLPQFERDGFVFGQWSPSSEREDGVTILPHYSLSPTAASFLRTAYNQNWVLTDFAWPSWMKTAEAISLRDDPLALAAASPTQLAQLLTVLIRQDRFVEGALGSAYESGLLTRILRRAAVLAQTPDEP